MAAFARSAPCWVDVQLPDLEAGKRFYGELFGWTFRPGEGPYADAFSGGRLVAALVAKQDGRMPTAWGIYFATDDAAASVARIREAGGTVITDPVWVGRAGVVAQAADPGGAVFGLWQAGEREGFEKQNEPVSFCWTEVHTRQRDRVDAFYEEVFGFQGTDLGASGADVSDSGTGSGTSDSGDSGSDASDASDADVPGTSDASGTSGAGGSGSAEPGATGSGTAGPGSAEPRTTERGSAEPGSAEPDATEHDAAASGPDFRMWSPAGTEPGPDTAIGGRSVITDAFPAELPSYFLVCFAVEDCNSTAGHAVRLGGRITEPPFDVPYGRMAVLQDDQGAVFAVLQPVVSGKRTE
ncbi:VOC family protein [Streptomyces sp. NPDC001279]|uniref:VOC family protein n=1 Tax=unclassified Streptomyces TaxID=2593676 RepID=UPI0036A66C80